MDGRAVTIMIGKSMVLAYHSGRNVDFLSVEEIRDLIRRHIRLDFIPK